MVKIYRLISPITQPLDFLEIGDIVYLSGIVATARDQVHKKVVVEGRALPIDIRNLAIWHAGPVAAKKDGKWFVVSIGSTTSSRMEALEPEFIVKTGVKMIIGKGFMGKRTAEACKRYGCIIAMYPGGLGALGARSIKNVLAVYWLEELGIPEALWVLEIEDLGPLIVTIDVKGCNLRDKILATLRLDDNVHKSL